jgi:hypothetical protein
VRFKAEREGCFAALEFFGKFQAGKQKRKTNEKDRNGEKSHSFVYSIATG